MTPDSRRRRGLDERLRDAALKGDDGWWELVEAVLFARAGRYRWQDVADVIGGTASSVQRRFGRYTTDDVIAGFLAQGHEIAGYTLPGQSIRGARRSGTFDS
jgi:hypothetical protein